MSPELILSRFLAFALYDLARANSGDPVIEATGVHTATLDMKDRRLEENATTCMSESDVVGGDFQVSFEV